MEQTVRIFLNQLYQGNSFSYVHLTATSVHLGKKNDDDNDNKVSDNNSGGGGGDGGGDGDGGGGSSGGGDYDDEKDGQRLLDYFWCNTPQWTRASSFTRFLDQT